MIRYVLDFFDSLFARELWLRTGIRSRCISSCGHVRGFSSQTTSHNFSQLPSALNSVLKIKGVDNVEDCNFFWLALKDLEQLTLKAQLSDIGSYKNSHQRAQNYKTNY